MNIIWHLTIKQANKINPRQVKWGTVFKIRKYFVFMKGLNSYVTTENSIIPLKESKMPNYIHRLIF